MKTLIGFLLGLLVVVVVAYSFIRGYDHREMTWIEDCDAMSVTMIGGVPYRCAPYIKKRLVKKKAAPKKKVQIYKRKGEFTL